MLAGNVDPFIHCIDFSNHYNFLNISKTKQKRKFGVVAKPWLSGILKWRIFLGKEKLKLKKKK